MAAPGFLSILRKVVLPDSHHDVEVQADSGEVLKQLRIDADVAGLTRLQETLTGWPKTPAKW